MFIYIFVFIYLFYNHNEYRKFPKKIQKELYFLEVCEKKLTETQPLFLGIYGLLQWDEYIRCLCFC